MAKKKKQDIEIKISAPPSEQTELNKEVAERFVNDLIGSFKEEGAFLEAERIANASDPSKEIDLILNEEEHSLEYLVNKRIHPL